MLHEFWGENLGIIRGPVESGEGPFARSDVFDTVRRDVSVAGRPNHVKVKRRDVRHFERMIKEGRKQRQARRGNIYRRMEAVGGA